MLYDGELAGTINMIGNIARDYAISGGTIYALYNEPSNGTWRLEVIDNTATASGTLNSWALNINEEWSGDLFVGNSITSDGDITTTGNIEVIQGSDLIFKNVAGTETFRIDGETGLITGASGSCPNGMTQMGDFCIEDNQRTSNAAWYTALERCDDPTRDGNDSGRPAGLRLCFMSEWQLACRKQRDGLAPSITGMNNSGQEWTGSIKSNYNEYAMWAQRCDNGEINSDGWGNSKQFRCCKNL